MLSTGTNLKSSINFDEVTPGMYEETDHGYTYSMYTETVMGNNELRSDDPSRVTRSRKDP